MTWQLDLTIKSKDYQKLLDLVNAIKNWKRFEDLEYLDHTIHLYTEKGV